MKPLEATLGNGARRNGSPKDALGEEQPDKTLVI
jgi:hypothetical protein